MCDHEKSLEQIPNRIETNLTKCENKIFPASLCSSAIPTEKQKGKLDYVDSCMESLSTESCIFTQSGTIKVIIDFQEALDEAETKFQNQRLLDKFRTSESLADNSDAKKSEFN